jgi:acrylyl-CoA reductase (NADPH)
MSEFKAMVLREVDGGKVASRVETLSETSLPEGDVTVAVEYSTLNYKWDDP